MISLTTMTMQLIDGDPDGIRICRVEGESRVTVVVQRDKLAQAKIHPNMPRICRSNAVRLGKAGGS